MLKKILFVVMAYLMVKKYRNGEHEYSEQYQKYIDDLNTQAELELEKEEQHVEPTGYIPANIKYTLSVGCLVGKKASVQLDVYISSLHNTTDIYVLRDIKPVLYVNGKIVNFQPASNSAYLLKPRSQQKISWSTNRAFAEYPDDVKWIRDFICEASGKDLITSVRSGWESSKTTMELQCEFAAQNMPEYVFNRGIVKNITGKLIYKGEAWYPGNN